MQASVCCLAIVMLLPSRSSGSGDHLGRLSRSLIYVGHTPILQFIGGFGVPVQDSSIESVILGYVFRTQYFMPHNASDLPNYELRPQPITGRAASIYRWVLYRGIETLLEKVGLPGRSCLLRVICEHAALPLSHESGLLAEILHIILTPSSSRDALAQHTDRDYLWAERFGRRGGDCRTAFAQKCKNSPMDLITMLIEVAV